MWSNERVLLRNTSDVDLLRFVKKIGVDVIIRAGVEPERIFGMVVMTLYRQFPGIIEFTVESNIRRIFFKMAVIKIFGQVAACARYGDGARLALGNDELRHILKDATRL